MANCDICFREIPPAAGEIISKEEFHIMVGIGFCPPLEVLDEYRYRTGQSVSLSSWRHAVTWGSNSAWHLCTACAKKAARYRPKEHERFVGRYSLPKGGTRDRSSIALSPDGKTAFSLGPTQATLIETLTAEPVIRWKMDLDYFNRGFAAFSADGRWLAYPENDHAMGLWAGPNWTAASQGRLAGSLFSGPGSDLGRPQFSRDGTRIALGHSNGTVGVWDCQSRRNLWRIRGGVLARVTAHTPPIAGLGWSPDGQVLVSGGAREVIWWSVATGEKLREWQLGGSPDDAISALAWSTDGARIIIGTKSGLLIALNASTARENQRTEAASIIALSRGGEFALGQWRENDPDGNDTYHIGVWDVTDETWLEIYEWPWEWLATDCCISDDGRTLLLGGNDGHLRVIAVDSYA